ncbi:serine hydrolase [Candidatus Zixiibacteriota bacterium]
MTNMRSFSIGLLILMVAAAGIFSAPARGEEGGVIDQLLGSRPDLFGPVLENLDKHEVQILYTQIDRDAGNKPRFRTHSYRLAPGAYFYPASSIKLPAAVLALEKLNRLDVAGLDKNTSLRIDSAYTAQTAVVEDSNSPTGLPTIAHYVHKLFVVSDNDAFNRLYEFVGQQHLNETLWNKDYRDIRITHRLAIARTSDQNRNTNPFTFFDGDRIIYRQPLAYNPTQYSAPEPVLRGKGYISGGQLYQEPKDFTRSNYVSLEVLQGILQAVLFPDAVPEKRRFQLTGDDCDLLYRAMSMRPRESRHPDYDPGEYYDGWAKFLMFGDKKDPMPDNIRIFSKSGLAYGTLTDNAYIVDFENKVEFLLTAMVYVNENQIFNDGVYEYDDIGLPFLANLGRVIYQYELERERENEPDLSRFVVEY